VPGVLQCLEPNATEKQEHAIKELDELHAVRVKHPCLS
jgi:hypothetical protein